MADYDDPRPSSQPTGSTEGVVAEDNLITLDTVMTAPTGTKITNRKGKVLTPMVDIVGAAQGVVQAAVDAVAADTIQNTDDIADLKAKNSVTVSDSELELTQTGAELQAILDDSASVLKAVAISAGTTVENVMLATNTTDAIVGYIYDVDKEITYSVPSDAQGKYIASVVGNILTTSDTSTYTLITELTAEEVSNSQAALKYGRFGINSVRGNSPWGMRGAINILGDSISHGTGSGGAYCNGWKSIFSRMINAQFGNTSYDGFVAIEDRGDIHTPVASATWTRETGNDTNAKIAYNGFALTTVTSLVNYDITLPSIQKKAIVWYIEQTGGGQLYISVNGVEQTTIDTSLGNGMASYIVDTPDNTNGSVVIRLAKLDGGGNPVTICGVGYINDTLDNCVHTFAQSGRQLRYVSESTIAALTSNATALVLALGINDALDCESDPTGYGAEVSARIDWIISYAKSSGCALIVSDFCWFSEKDSYIRSELKRAAEETDGIYIPLPDLITGDGTLSTNSYRINGIKMWDDAYHPNEYGHAWIAETMAKYLGLTVTSKHDALAFHDHWMPFDLSGISNRVNYNLDAVSAYKMNGSKLNFRYGITTIAGVDPVPAGIISMLSGLRPINGNLPPIEHTGPTLKTVVGRISTGGNIQSNVSISDAFDVNLNIPTASEPEFEGEASISAKINIS